MLNKTRGIILHNTRYRDSSIISHIFTQEYGRVSVIFHGIRNQKGNFRPAHIQLLNMVDLVLYMKSGKSIYQVRELQCNPPIQSIHYDVLKNSVAMFTSEMLHACLHDAEPDHDLFNFVERFIQILDLETESIRNYPLYFLVQFSKYLGFYPKGNFEDGSVFDLTEGSFMPSSYTTPVCLSPETSFHLDKLLRTALRDITELRIPNPIRRQLIDDMLRYYDIHLLHGRPVKSHVILREVLD